MSCLRLAERRYSSITLFFAARARKATRCRESSNSVGAVRMRRKKLPQTLWRKSSESNRERKQPRQLPANHQADLGLESLQQLARGSLVSGLDPLQEIGKLAVFALVIRSPTDIAKPPRRDQVDNPVSHSSLTDLVVQLPAQSRQTNQNSAVLTSEGQVFTQSWMRS